MWPQLGESDNGASNFNSGKGETGTIAILPFHYDNWAVFGEEIMHWIHSVVISGKDSPKDVEEFFGYLGRHIAKRAADESGLVRNFDLGSVKVSLPYTHLRADLVIESK